MQFRIMIISLLALFAFSTPAAADISGSAVYLGAHTSMHTGTMDIVFEINGVSPANDETIFRVDLSLPKEWTINNITRTPANVLACQAFGTIANNPPAFDANGDYLLAWEGSNVSCPPWDADSIGTSTIFVANVTIPSCAQFPWSSNWRIFGGGVGFTEGTLTINECEQLTSKTLSSYKFAPLNHPNRVSFNYLTSINDKGTIVGSYSPTNSSSNLVPFIYQNREFQSIPVFFDAASTLPLGINENDKIAGLVIDWGDIAHGFTYSSTEGLTALDYNEPGITGTSIEGINSHDAMVFYLFDGGFQYTSAVDYNQFQVYPFNYPGTSVTGNTVKLTDLNDQSTLVGSYEDSTGLYHGFIFKSGVYTDVMVPGSDETHINGISNNGMVVGFYHVGATSHGFVFDGKSNYQTFDFPGSSMVEGYDINNNGTIVGVYFDSFSAMYGFVARPFSWSIFLPAIVTPK